ncbi:MAG: hypothetical protein ABI603_06190, partial [Acidobacteriota bacterium]
VYMLWMFQRINYGEITNPKNLTLPDLTPREWVLMVPTVAICIVMGVFPGVFLRPIEPSVNRTLERITGRNYGAVPRSLPLLHGAAVAAAKAPAPGAGQRAGLPGSDHPAAPAAVSE